MLVGHKDGSLKTIYSHNIKELTKGYKTYTVIGGEFAIAKDSENIAFKTLLGSCVAIMFYDQKLQIKGMNHFLLPITNSSNEDMKYGLYSVETMLNEMYKMGCKKQNMIAKIAGGADVSGLKSITSTAKKSIGQRNVEFAVDFCKVEGFKIISNHTRGTTGRVILVTNNFETFIKKIDNYTQNCQMFKTEQNLQNEVLNKKRHHTIELF